MPPENFKLYDQQVHTVHIPEPIRKQGVATSEIIAEGVAFLQRDGIIVLENAIDTSHLDALNSILSPEAIELGSNPSLKFNFDAQARNIDQAPPPRPDIMFKDIWCNPFAVAILAATLGPRPVVHYANGNTALKATGRQPVHSDCGFEHPLFPFAMVVNIPLVDVGVENGATEVWVGSHAVSTAEEHRIGRGECRRGERSLEIDLDTLEERRRHSPPVRACSKKGSLVIRDLRLWHAGVPNQTDEPRVMLAFVVQPEWWKGKGKIKLPVEARELVEGWKELRFEAEWVESVDQKDITNVVANFDGGSAMWEKYSSELARKKEYYPRSY